MILIFIILISIGQVLIYLITDRFKFKYGKALMLTLILLGHFIIFPKYFIPEPGINKFDCGLPILGITLAFWIVGNAITLLTHIFYSVVKKRISPTHNNS